MNGRDSDQRRENKPRDQCQEAVRSQLEAAARWLRDNEYSEVTIKRCGNAITVSKTKTERETISVLIPIPEA